MNAEAGTSHKEIRTTELPLVVELNDVTSMTLHLGFLIGAYRRIIPWIRLQNNTAVVG